MDGSGKKVYVGLSGGVDSSLSAALLKEQGYDVTGVFIKIWQPFDDAQGRPLLECTWPQDRLDAMRVCAQLGIPFTTLDLSETYKREVVDYMISEYREGRTPNPDVMCNQQIKFGAFLDWAKTEQGADFVATGHYAQKREENEETSGAKKTFLTKAKDVNKDQTYFLWTLTQDQLSHTLFPIGHLTKPEVRAAAAERGLVTASKKDSQGVCFVGKLDMKVFLKKFIDAQPGDVLDESGAPIGTHDGAVFYTIGERRGFSVPARSPEAQPLFVVSKDIRKNTITVSPHRAGSEGSAAISEIVLEKPNWIAGVPESGEQYEARLRYRQPLRTCRIEIEGRASARAVFSEPQAGIAPGQSFVAYQGDRCLGGGRIAPSLEHRDGEG